MPTLLAPIAAVLLTLGGGGGGGDATVVSVGDGDSLRLRRGEAVIAVRLACIDAPELRQRPHGQASRRVLRELAPVGSTVQLRRFSTDRYGRLVAELSHRGVNVNQRLVQRGAAFVYWAYIRGCDRQTYARLETEARLRRLGVWDLPGGLERPWELRARSRR
jgi:endonuclease YncB( thermonuclease family)